MGFNPPSYKWYAHPAIMLYATAWLIVLLIVGTLAQKEMGLHLAQQTFFSSWWLSIGPLPLPGGRLTMAVIGVSLALKLLREREWSRKTVGVHVVHLGAVLLFAGGFLTAYFSEEGHLTLKEAETGRLVRDYHAPELAVIETSDPNVEVVTAYAANWLQPGQDLIAEDRPFTVTVRAFTRNCEVSRRKSPAPPEYRGMAQRFELVSLPDDPEAERNRAGLSLVIHEPNEIRGTYLLVEGATVDQTLTVGDRSYRLVLRNEQRQLPFAVELLDFERVVYPGTEKPKHFRSVVHVIDEDGLKRRAVIQMNEPLRHRGYTLYQSSFASGPVETSVFAVVKNVGRIFPYLSSLVMCAGLLFHLLVYLPILIQRQSRRRVSPEGGRPR